jgi:hypothetical protein
MAHPARAAAPAAADGVEDLLAVVADRAQEHPPREAVEALALLIVGFVRVSGRGVVGRVANPNTGGIGPMGVGPGLSAIRAPPAR